MNTRMACFKPVATLTLTLAGCGTLVMAGGAQAETGQSVNTFPSPGGHVASPRTQIAFRGVNVDRLGAIAKLELSRAGGKKNAPEQQLWTAPICLGSGKRATEAACPSIKPAR